jgi:hypothetical protein
MATGGSDGIKQPISLEGDQEVRKAFEQIGAAGQKAFSDINAAASKGTANLGRLGSTFSGVSAGFDKLKASIAPIGAHLTSIHERTTKLGEAMTNVARRTIPNFETLLAGATIGGAAGFVALISKTAEWGHELEENSRRLGTTPTELSLIGKAAKEARVPMDQLVAGMTRFSISLEAAAQKQETAMDKIVEMVLGTQKLAGGGGVLDMTKRIGELSARLIEVTPNIKGFDQAVEAMFNLKQSKGEIPASFTLGQFRLALDRTRNSTAKARQEIDDELAKLGADVPNATISDALRRGTEGFKDTFAQLGVAVRDTAGQLRKPIDVFGDFLEAFKALGASKQSQIVLKDFGRGALDLIPIMQQGREGLFKFLDAARAKGADTSVFERDIAKAAELDKALIVMEGAFSRLRNALILPLADVFTPFAEAVTKALDSPAIKASLNSLALSIKEVIGPIAQDIAAMLEGKDPTSSFVTNFLSAKDTIVAAIGVLTSAFNGLIEVFNVIASSINAVFGTELTGKTLLIGTAVLQLTGVFGLIATAIGLAVSAIGTFVAIAGAPVALAVATIASAGLAIYANWSNLQAMFASLWSSFTEAVAFAAGKVMEFGQWVRSEFVAAWTYAINAISALWTGLLDTVSSVFNTIMGFLKTIGSKIGSAIDAAGNLASRGLGFASGGMVRGPGSSVSDSIHARLSDGEFVMRSAAVSHWGPRMMYALNALRSPLAEFAGGGLVGGPLMSHAIPRFAEGGLVAAGGGTPVHLHLGGGSFALSGNDSVVSALVVEAHRQQIRSAGTKPSWFAARPSGR